MSRVEKSITSGGSLFPNLIITAVKKCGFHFCFESLSFFSPQSFFCLGKIKKPWLIFPPCESSYGIAPQLSCLSFPATHSPLLISFLWLFSAPNPIFPHCSMGTPELDVLGLSLLDSMVSKVFSSPVNSLILWDSVSVLLGGVNSLFLTLPPISFCFTLNCGELRPLSSALQEEFCAPRAAQVLCCFIPCLFLSCSSCSWQEMKQEQPLGACSSSAQQPLLLEIASLTFFSLCAIISIYFMNNRGPMFGISPLSIKHSVSFLWWLMG